jgi:hypothetical protein
VTQLLWRLLPNWSRPPPVDELAKARLQAAELQLERASASKAALSNKYKQSRMLSDQLKAALREIELTGQ